MNTNKLFESLINYQNIKKPAKRLKESDDLSFADMVKDSYNHFVNDLGKTPTLSDIVDDIINSYDQIYISDDTPEKSRTAMNEVRYTLSKLNLPYELDESSNSENKQELLSRIFNRFPDISEEDEDYLNSLSLEELKAEIKNRGWNEELDESNLNEAANNADEPMVYMNTWKNYNEYGADLELYGNIDGWMNPEQAKEFAEKYSEDEPFINDTDNVPWQVSEYDNVIEVLNYLEKYNQADNKEALQAIIESQGENNLDEAFRVYESGDYTFFAGVETDEDLGRAYVDMVGGLSGVSDADKYIDEDAYRESWRETAVETVREDDPDLETEDYDAFEANVEDIMHTIADEQLEIDKTDGADLSEYFDYEAFGRDLDYEGYFFASTGAVQVL